MPTNPTIPTPKSTDVVSFTIKINGEPIPVSINVLSIDVWNEMNRIPKAKIIVADGDSAKEDFEWSNNEIFQLGNLITISLGYHSEEKDVFKGIIIGQKIKVRKDVGNKLIIECKDEYCKLTQIPRSKYFYEVKDSDVIEEIIDQYQLNKNIEATEYEHPEIVQYNCTDWDFIMLRTEGTGKLAAIDNGELMIQKPDFGAEELFDVTYGSSLLEFDLEVNAHYQPNTIKSNTWDYTTQELLEIEANEPGFDAGGDLKISDLAEVYNKDPFLLQLGEYMEESSLQSMSDAQLMRARLAKIRGRLQFQGNADVKPFSLLKLNGVGEHFNGKIMVSGVRHRVINGNWFTDVDFGLDPTPFAKQFEINMNPQQQMPSISGLQTAVVTQLEEDPNGEFRIKVRLPAINLDEDGIWARVASIDAGDSRGIYFRPEIDDEVVIGFINNNPKNPIVLGCLHSSAKPSPIEPSDDNHEKGIITRSENKILINDDTNTISIETPAGKKIILDEDSGDLSLEDDNGNKIVLNTDGITIESGGDINIETSGDINIKGMNIANEANSNFTADGKAGAEVTTNGTAVLKGSIVQIN